MYAVLLTHTICNDFISKSIARVQHEHRKYTSNRILASISPLLKENNCVDIFSLFNYLQLLHNSKITDKQDIIKYYSPFFSVGLNFKDLCDEITSQHNRYLVGEHSYKYAGENSHEAIHRPNIEDFSTIFLFNYFIVLNNTLKLNSQFKESLLKMSFKQIDVHTDYEKKVLLDKINNDLSTKTHGRLNEYIKEDEMKLLDMKYISIFDLNLFLLKPFQIEYKEEKVFISSD